MFTIILAIAGTTAFGALAARYGAEQRPGFDERPESLGPHHYGLR